MRIYLDNAATTPLHPKVIEHVSKLMSEVYGNPSSIHEPGRKAKTIIEEGRKIVANILKSSIGEIFFTSSATEANNTILRKAVSDLGIRNIVTSPTEHPCVLNTLKNLESENKIQLRFLNVDRAGNIDTDELNKTLSGIQGPKLVSLMYVNNETGVINDIKEISKICSQHKALFHCDAVQAIGKLSIDVQETHFDFLAGSAHKFHGPKGIGFMYINHDISITPFITGGGQERNMRSGTENSHGISGLALALKIYDQQRSEIFMHVKELKDHMKSGLKKILPNILFIEDHNGTTAIPHILSVGFPDHPKTELITFNLDISGISASAGSACASGVEQASHVLEAIQFPEDRRAVRFSFSSMNTKGDIDFCLEKIENLYS